MKNITLKALMCLSLFLFSNKLYAQEDIEKIPLEKMAKFESLLGEWNTTNYFYEENDWKEVATSHVKYFKKLKGKLVSEEISNVIPAGGFVVESFISYDQYRNVYRLAAIDDTFGLMDIYEGDFENDKIFRVTNLRAGTNFPTSDGGELYFRLTFKEIDANTREFLVEQSNDNGQIWRPMYMNKLTRAH